MNDDDIAMLAVLISSVLLIFVVVGAIVL